MSHWKRLWSLIALLGLAACGGGGSSSGTPGLGSPQTPKATDLVVVLSKSEISNTGNETVTATVTAVDANRNGVADVPVTVAVNNGAVVSVERTTTDASGTLVAVIGIGSDRSNRTLTVSVTAGQLSRSAELKVVTVAGNPTPTADDLSLVLSAPSLTNGGSATVTATVTAVDRNRNVVSGIPVTVSVDASATAAVSAPITDQAGVVTAQIGIGSDRSNRVVTVTATSGNLVKTASFAVTGARLTSSASPLVVAGSSGNVIEYTLVDFNAIAMVDQTVTVTANGLPSVTGRTDLNGKFRYVYTAPVTPGTIDVLATAAGDQRAQSVTVSAASTGVAPASEPPQSASITPTPSVVTVNSSGSNSNQVELRALFLGANNKPVPRVRVRFDLAGNTTSTDGVVSWVGSYAYSDENGVARGTFTPGLRPSPTNGITIRACYDVGDFASGPASACDGVPASTTATLTVASEALSVAIRTNELIKSGRNDLTYIKEYVVMVVDSAGQAKADVLITPSVDLINYEKGFWFFDKPNLIWKKFPTLPPGEAYQWTGTAWEQAPATSDRGLCPNEDVNRNGVREAGVVVPGAAAPVLSARQEDLNWNGDLDPRKADVAIKMVDSAKTDANGLAVVQIEYGRNLASWVDYMITVTASGVSGTEARARFVGTLPIEVSAITSETAPPPFRFSPYGTGSSCQTAD